MEIVQAVKKLNSIWRERLNFLRRPNLCAFVQKPIHVQASNFGSSFDQLFLWNFFMQFSHKIPLYFFYTMVQKSKKWPKTQIEGSCLKKFTKQRLILKTQKQRFLASFHRLSLECMARIWKHYLFSNDNCPQSQHSPHALLDLHTFSRTCTLPSKAKAASNIAKKSREKSQIRKRWIEVQS